MKLMTKSQLDDYQFQAKSLKLHATQITNECFKEFITEFLRCFEE